MKLRVDFEVPDDFKQMVAFHIGKDKVSKDDIRDLIGTLVECWVEDVSSDYELSQEEEEE